MHNVLYIQQFKEIINKVKKKDKCFLETYNGHFWTIKENRLDTYA